MNNTHLVIMQETTGPLVIKIVSGAIQFVETTV